MAIKILPENFADDPDRMARFDREAQLLGVQSSEYRSDIRRWKIEGAGPWS